MVELRLAAAGELAAEQVPAGGDERCESHALAGTYYFCKRHVHVVFVNGSSARAPGRRLVAADNAGPRLHSGRGVGTASAGCLCFVRGEAKEIVEDERVGA